MSGMSTATALAQSRDFVIVREVGMCVECDDQPALLACEQCGDDYCDYCFTALHKKGQRKTHTTKRISVAPSASDAAAAGASKPMTDGGATPPVESSPRAEDAFAEMAAAADAETAQLPSATPSASAPSASAAAAGSDTPATATSLPPSASEAFPPTLRSLATQALDVYPGFRDRVPFAPLRLSESERQLLLILQDALQVSEYTANVDCLHSAREGGRRTAQINELSSIYSLLLGMSAAHDVKAIRKVTVSAGAKAGHFAANAHLFQVIFEVGRRHKIRNPDKMRTTYGQMMHLLMDAQHRDIVDAFGFSPVSPIKTIESVLAPYGATALLDDVDFCIASSPLTVRRALTPEARRAAVLWRIHALERLKGRWTAAGDDGSSSFACPPEAAAAAVAAGGSAVAAAAAGGLVAEKTRAEARAGVLATLPLYQPPQTVIDSALNAETGADGGVVLQRPEPHPRLPLDVLQAVIHAASDSTVFLQQAVAPIDSMERRLKSYEDADKGNSSAYTLAISAGSQGARLTHSHREQFEYVLQTFYLWRLISLNMYKLWFCADADMLMPGNFHSLRNTGQGLNRMQAAPNVGRVMATIMGQAHRAFPRWVGSSAVHLGDINVPNALFFIDKYSQVERILAPIVATANSLDRIIADFDAVEAERRWRRQQVPTGRAGELRELAQDGEQEQSGDEDEDDDDDSTDAEARTKRPAVKAKLAAIDAALDGWAHKLTAEVKAALVDPLYGTRPILPPLSLAHAQAQAGEDAEVQVAQEITGPNTDPLGTGLPVWPPAVYTPERQREMLSGWVRSFYNSPSKSRVRKTRDWILSNFFRHAFDGSGADDYFSAGSCIDGRLTSAWNWCSKLETKTYHSLFLATEFVGFEGQWSE